MKLSIKVLDILFRHIEPEAMLVGLLDNRTRMSAALKTAFMDMAEVTLSGYSIDEQESIFELSRQVCQRYTSDPPFWLLYDFAEKTLTIERGRLLCRADETLSWRDAYLLLGQDIFSTAWLAGRPGQFTPISHFSWSAVIPSNSLILERTLSDLAENHMHLYAGASTFSLTWSYLMNHPGSILQPCKEPQSLERSLQIHYTRRSGGPHWSAARKIMYAAYIRELLFIRLHMSSTEPIEYLLRKFHSSYVSDDYMCGDVSATAEDLRRVFGIFFPQPGYAAPACLDYAFSHELANERERHSRLLAGERLLMYRWFQGCLSNEFSADEQWIFYIYLLLKSQFRSEFIQSNKQTGFANFSLYDKRKYVLWQKHTEYWSEDYRQALNASFAEQPITSIEGRVSPQSKAFETLKSLHQIDRATLYYDADGLSRWEYREWMPSFFMENKTRNAQHYYVMHFAKRSDTAVPGFQRTTLIDCRQKSLRDDVRKKAIELAKALSNSDYLCERVRGIDACSNEIGCRPEVFATAFRFLRNFSVRDYRFLGYNRLNPGLSATYHVGEDFLDIADGLRAIDEAIYFLGLRPGDRLGHALVLGVDPAIHYRHKNYQIVMSKQDMLDNLVWLCYRGPEFGIKIDPLLLDKLHGLADELFNEIYRDFTEDASTTLVDYYHSMLLRGDLPSCYITGEFSLPRLNDPIDFFGVNHCSEIEDKLEFYRKQNKVTRLCICYHYCIEVRRRSSVLMQMDITPDYMALMAQFQVAMRRRVCNCGISIECNPSSNVLIGTFEQYQQHPILLYNSHGLGRTTEDVQLHISVNTDDPGIFDTNLAFEYALLTQALREMVNKAGERIYDDRDIEEYIRNLVRMGREQCFPAVQSDITDSTV